jgi:hypothetical protein
MRAIRAEIAFGRTIAVFSKRPFIFRTIIGCKDSGNLFYINVLIKVFLGCIFAAGRAAGAREPGALARAAWWCRMAPQSAYTDGRLSGGWLVESGPDCQFYAQLDQMHAIGAGRPG